jgi:hypothetical protein
VTVNFAAFSRGMGRVEFLRHMVHQLQARRAPEFGLVPEDYDFSASTNSNYRDDQLPRRFFGAHQEIRAARDYEYHVNYTDARQLWQDAAVSSVVARTQPQSQPWVVYTCGPMGAGKGHVLSWMSENGYFPLEDIVHIDPDHFKKLMPEWKEYVARGELAGNFCHRESGYIQEIAQEVAMRNSQNVWVDGSLRDGVWFASVFKDIRKRFPRYKIAIFEVSASEAAVRARVAQRAEETGRSVPEHLIAASLGSVASSLELLTPLSDFVARILNEDETPQLRAYIRIDATGDWSAIKSQFANPETGAFPHAHAPLSLRAVPAGLVSAASDESIELDAAHPSLAALLPYVSEAPRRLSRVRAGAARADGGAGRGPASLRLRLSPRSAVTLNREARRLAGVPADATTYAFAYHSDQVAWGEITPGADLSAPSCLLALAGGFVYWDRALRIVAVNAISDVDEGRPDEAEAGTEPRGALLAAPIAERKLLQFGPPLPLETRGAEGAATLRRLMAERMHPVTLASLIDRGASRFCWLGPGELSSLLAAPPKSGAFAYELQEGGKCYFPVANID